MALKITDLLWGPTIPKPSCNLITLWHTGPSSKQIRVMYTPHHTYCQLIATLVVNKDEIT